ncbi:MAG: thioredoxin [Bacteroidaceae bacterium]|nr:thioredoxin [Bacteroidaceae bacterium]
MVKKLTEAQYTSLDAAGIKLIDFNATWCGPCKMMAPVFEELSEEYAGKIDFYKVDTDENPGLAQQFRVVSIPAIALVKDGVFKDMHVGFVPKEQLKEFIEQNL